MDQKPTTTYLRSEETGDGDAGGEADGHRHGGDSHRHVVSGAKVERNKGQPDHARRVHSETCNNNQEGTETGQMRAIRIDCFHCQPVVTPSGLIKNG